MFIIVRTKFFSWTRHELAAVWVIDSKIGISVWEAFSSSARQAVPPLVWNPQAHNRVHKCYLLYPVLCRFNPDLTLTPCSLRPVCYSYPPTCTKTSKSLLYFFRLNQLIFHRFHACYVLFPSAIFDFINLTILAKEHKLWNSSVYEFSRHFRPIFIIYILQLSSTSLMLTVHSLALCNQFPVFNSPFFRCRHRTFDYSHSSNRPTGENYKLWSSCWCY